MYIESQAQQLNIPTPCITFDQPLWLKAVEIVKAKSLNIVCRLCGFHVMMSFIGSIGSMMKGSGLEEALETVYGSNAVTHMISGKAISRALRGHFLVEAALVNKLILEVLPNENDGSDDTGGSPNEKIQQHDGEVDMEPVHSNEIKIADQYELELLYKGVKDKSVPVSNIAESKELLKLEECLLKYRKLLAESSRTANLWLQYIEYVETLKLFIRNWTLHLVAVGRMMNLFAATGHIHYAKSSRLYLQQMLDLPNDYPWLYQCFVGHGFHTVRRSSRYWAGLWTDLTIEQVMMRSIKSRGGLTRGTGLTESVCQQWIYSMHRCAGVHEAMTTLTNLKHMTSEQHIELGISRSRRDFKDLSKIQEWFDQHEPFDLNEPRLRSLSSGLTAADGDGINCDRTEVVGAKIQKSLDNMTVLEASIRRSEQVQSLHHLYPAFKVDKKKVHINPTLLFTRVVAIVQREEDMTPYFDYELTTVPTSLFKDNTMRKPAKAQLAKALTDSLQPSERNMQAVHVLDGGALLHRVRWAKNAIYKDVAKQYVRYVRAKYGQSCIVFDGYQQGPSIKDHEHQRRIGKTCAEIQLKESLEAHNSQQAFLSNESNKSQFISLLTKYLKEDGQIVHNSTGDADTLIVKRALEFAINQDEVNVVADDTDVLILLIYHWQSNMADIYFHSEVKKSQKKSLVLKICDIICKVGQVITDNILFLHAWSGCDTTSATFGHGKTTLLKKIKESGELQQISSLMYDPDATAEQIGKAGNRLFIILYGGKQEDSLNRLRYAKFMEMVSSAKTSIDPQKLPPTERAAYFHSLRVHLQVILWKRLTNADLDPQQWGWKLNGAVLTPVMTDKEVAPESLLKFVRCKCKVSSRNTCGSNICSCRKNGLKCVTACGDCRGENCKNAEEVIFNVTEDNIDIEEVTIDQI